jgi:phosphatidylserine/phosphatidylglycerophosphate/cardiolipin synthase-like enzyme
MNKTDADAVFIKIDGGFNDHQTAIIGGMNLASEYLGPQASMERRQDISLLVQGPVVDHLA